VWVVRVDAGHDPRTTTPPPHQPHPPATQGRETMTLVTTIDRTSAPLLVRDLFDGGDPGPIVGALAQVPELCEVTLPFLGSALGASAVSARRKEIAIVRTSANLACRFCTDTHTVVGAGEGLDHDELAALRHERDVADVFTNPSERALIDWVDVLSLGVGPVNPLVAVTAKGLLGDHQLVELTVTVGATMLLNRLATGLELPVSADTVDGLDRLGFASYTRPTSTRKASS
jgi:AhpD family alkylhydroperoxidase